tara:strand:- start:59 stop:319 length:261 start_codon:yes stop_codon:yes gene_type:complete
MTKLNQLSAKWSVSFKQDLIGFSDEPERTAPLSEADKLIKKLEDEIKSPSSKLADNMAKEIADEIDREIIKTLTAAATFTGQGLIK